MPPKINLFIEIVKKMIHDDQVSIQVEKEDLAENTRLCQLNVDIKGWLELRNFNSLASSHNGLNFDSTQKEKSEVGICRFRWSYNHHRN